MAAVQYLFYHLKNVNIFGTVVTDVTGMVALGIEVPNGYGQSGLVT
jgi:hypothetical protein